MIRYKTVIFSKRNNGVFEQFLGAKPSISLSTLTLIAIRAQLKTFVAHVRLYDD